MDFTTTDLDALTAEIAALEREDAEQTARLNGLLRQGSAAVLLADCQAMSAIASRELAVQERYQRRLRRAIDAR